MTRQQQYIEIDKFYKSLDEVRGAINELGQSLGDKIDRNKESFDAAILKLHMDYTQRLTRLETHRKEEWKTRILYGACAGMATWILNHIFK